MFEDLQKASIARVRAPRERAVSHGAGPGPAVLWAMVNYFILSKMGSHWRVFKGSVEWSHLHFYKIVLATENKWSQVGRIINRYNNLGKR